MSASDHSKVVAWLTSQGLIVSQSGRGRNWISFSGTAGQVSQALQTPIHRFAGKSVTHYANTADPSVPEALAEVVGGFLGFDDFPLRSFISRATPEYNSGANHYLSPQDWATIRVTSRCCPYR